MPENGAIAPLSGMPGAQAGAAQKTLLA